MGLNKNTNVEKVTIAELRSQIKDAKAVIKNRQKFVKVLERWISQMKKSKKNG